MRRGEQGRGLRAVVFLDTVASTQIAASLGDRRWQTLLRRQLQILRKLLKDRGGQEIDVAGDGLFALFREPAPAVRLAASAAEAVREIGLEIRAGVHFGEVEFADGRPGGIVVHTGARTMGLGGAGEVIVTEGVRGLLSGGGLSFAGHGTHELKGVPGSWPLFRLVEVDERPVPAPLSDDEADTRRRASSVPPALGRRTFLGGIAAAAVAGSFGTYLATRDDEPPVRPPPRNNKLFRFDPVSDELTVLASGLIAPVGNFLACLAVGEGALWTGDTVLHHVDPDSGDVVDVEVPVAGGLPLINDVATGFDDVWFVDIRNLYRVDPADDELLDSYGLVEAPPGAPGSFPTAVAVGLDGVWASINDGSLFRFDPDGDLTRPDRLSLGGTPSDLAVAAGALWVADEFGRILRVDPDGDHRVTPIDVGGGPRAIAATEDRVWAVDPAGIVIVVDPDGRREPERIPLPGDLVDVVAGLDAVWVADRNGDLVELDVGLRKEARRIPLEEPISALAVDEERRRHLDPDDAAFTSLLIGLGSTRDRSPRGAAAGGRRADPGQRAGEPTQPATPRR